MTPDIRSGIESTVVMDRQAMAATIRSLALAVANGNPNIENLVILGILRRGRPLADRLARIIGEYTGVVPPVGSLATTLYRDDVRSGAAAPLHKGDTHFDFSIEDRTVLLVDDVLAAGRTIRAALDEVMDYGRPKRIQLACLVDRGGRELPIRADYLGYDIGTGPGEWIYVRLEEIDGEDAVLLQRSLGQPSEQEGA